MKRAHAAGTALLLLAAALGAVLATSTATAAGSLTATFSKDSDWGSGYQARFTITNGTSGTITSWRVEFDLPSGTSVGTYWDSLKSGSGNHHVFTNREYNGRIAPGGSTSFGYIVSGSGVPSGCTINGAACSGGGGGGDTQPPTVPSGLHSTGATSTSVSLAWNASSDNVGVTGYDVYRDGASVQSVTGTTATVTGLSPSTAYRFAVRAKDAAGNTSARSGEISVTTGSGGGGGGTPVEVNGQLRVCGTKLCNQHNQPIQLRGMSSHGLQWYSQCLNTASLDALADDWKADVLRISMYIQEGGYETDPRLFTDRVHNLIEMATARGMYAIVDWHMLSPGDPNYNLDRAKTFFTEIAGRHKNKPNVLYEVANEPNGVSWSSIRGYAHQIIPVIRAQDADGIVLVGTRAWSSLGVSDGADESEVVNSPVNASNIMYTFHFYAASHRDAYLSVLSRSADRIPVFVTEFGTQDYAGEGANDFAMSQRYLDVMAQKKISWVNWNFSDDHRSGAVFTTGTCPGGPFAGTSRLKQAGVWIRDQIRANRG